MKTPVISEESAREFRRVFDKSVFPFCCWQRIMDPVTGAEALIVTLGNIPRFDEFVVTITDILDRASKEDRACTTAEDLRSGTWEDLAELLGIK